MNQGNIVRLAGCVMTVCGAVRGAELGPTSVHEHLYCDISVHSGRPDNIVTDVVVMADELAAVRRAFCRFDLIGWNELTPDGVRAERIATLCQLGYAGQIVLGSDTCRRSQLRANGGRGLDFLWTSFVPRLVALGARETDIDAMLVDAPARLLAGA